MTPLDGGMAVKTEGKDVPEQKNKPDVRADRLSYQGAGKMMVRRSHTAMESSTVLVGELMLCLRNKLYRRNDKVPPAS